MNYRHIYHAGNFADVFKHVVLLALIDALSKKEKPWCYLDTHAGTGRYDLFSMEAQKTKEFQNGVQEIVTRKIVAGTTTHAIIQQYLSILKSEDYPHFYPGSPSFVYHCLRPQDRMVLIEKHPEEAMALKMLFKERGGSSHQTISIHQQDGYQSIKAFLPPKERRGLILIDPPFEQLDEWEQIVQSLKLGMQRFASGIFAIWYPIKDTISVQRFHQALQALNQEPSAQSTESSGTRKEILIAEFHLYPETMAQGLRGAGMVIVNPPWKMMDTLNPLLKELYDNMSMNDLGRFVLKWIE